MSSISCGILAFGAVLSADIIQAQEDAYSIEDVAFLAGHWVGAEGTGRPEEVWFGPAGGVMTGMFRWPSAGGRYVVELLTISGEEDGVVFRFKHFDPDITAWEKNQPNTYRLAEVEDGCASFAGTEVAPGAPAQIQYCLTGDGRLIFRGGTADEHIDDAQFMLEFTPRD